MSSLSIIGNLMDIYLDDINSSGETDTPEFLIKASARLLKEKDGRNWIPLLVKETGEDKYEVIANSFIYAVAKEAGLDRVWCIIADDSDDTAETTKVLAKEKTPKINLCTASRDEIVAALQYLIEQPGSALKTVKLAVAANRIDEAPRQSWQKFDPIIKLKCGITKGAKLEALKQVFYLTPQPMPEETMKADIAQPKPEKTRDKASFKTMTVAELKEIAKEKGIAGVSKMKKDELIAALS
ncbi:Rho termination factor N-terminal domain-containing protein [Chlorogloea sp. CCALA 695]|uniref:Rho termination factor N-terminal domain-containing protein n=1 Tax=Chlorogloea sp. CCALA 695 TaxID=2107693 RepID=UPI000D05E73F|nr:Rho termination factor N-terminal domain-containing protein [Chlorogloea sp. CCALA 695]PSB31808.1 Rho termination factor [Chlorogloea sp. CCALA 695]